MPDKVAAARRPAINLDRMSCRMRNAFRVAMMPINSSSADVGL
jgi:hypothetical protein